MKTAQTQPVQTRPVQTQPASPQPPRPSAVDKADKNKQTKHGKTAPTPSKFWSDLIWVRPWLLVGGLWLTFVLMIAIALAGLSNPGQEMVLEPVSSSIDGQPLSAPDAAAAARLSTRDGLSLAQRDPAATLPPEAVEQTMPTWPLLVMVVACAGGCMLMSRNEGLTQESRRGRRRVAGVAPKLRPVTAAGSGRGSRKRRARRLGAERPGAQVMAFRKGQKIRRTPHQPKPVASKPVSFAMPKEAATQVTVVPEAATSPLDWKEGSLAHKLDVRQRRSINSFL
ncbi:hypothetical protein IQ260_06600 [Leptolyngbya cf. ectocarpi LEGE 11479]|uniref:Uncharacterized protein n=1 Tax=Leptolyngbya cf. ectocarpi LEGE 11479 TaxID=1828722 RepID=A0A928X3D1_LEPEC|nr:hypothetical protein [Leptolyngbya ectocarpi]MBE9066318.1 hypothetical protein [Leptolyngbya cf. ectocarpi LEGE 11479]